jgi:hypothetical protein
MAGPTEPSSRAQQEREIAGRYGIQGELPRQAATLDEHGRRLAEVRDTLGEHGPALAETRTLLAEVVSVVRRLDTS